MTNYFRITVAILMFFLAGVVPHIVWAGTKQVNVQGKLTDGAGNPLTGSQTMTFRLYTSSNSPIANAVWTEMQGVTPQNGLFNVTLGNVTTLDALPFNIPYYLGMQVAGDPIELQPRQLLGAAGYALGSSGNFDVSGNVTAKGITVDSITVNNLGTIPNLKDGRTTGNACAGCIGEYVSATWTADSTAANDVWYDAAALTLTAGDWDVTMTDNSGRNANSTLARIDLGISTTPGNSYAGMVVGDNWAEVDFSDNVTGTQRFVAIPTYRVHFSSMTTVYAKLNLNGPGAYAPHASGRISARRM